MTQYVTIHFYEFSLTTKNKVQRQNTPLPPIDNVSISLAFGLLERHMTSLTTAYVYDNGNFSTTIEYIHRTNNKIELVFGHYDGIAPSRTLRHRITGEYNIQERTDEEDIKNLCHCVIKLNDEDPILAKIGIENVTGIPISILTKTLNHYFRQLEIIAPNTENVFQITNPDNARNPDGTDNIHHFILNAKFYPMAGQMLTDAILSGRLQAIRLNGRRTTGLDDPNRRLQYAKASIDFGVHPLTVNDTPQSYLRSVIDMAMRNRFHLEDVKTFVIIENEAENEQSIEIDENNALNTAFVLKKKFDATIGRANYPDNTQINQIFLDEIYRRF